MKKLATLILLFTACHLAVSAQPGQCPMQHRGGGKLQNHGRHGAMMSKLNLSQDQKDRIRAIHEDSRKQMEALRENKQQSLQQFDDARARIHQETKQKVDAVFTSEQKATLAGLKKEREEKQQARLQQKLDRMKSRLNLSETQYSQMKSLQEKNHQAIRAIRDNEKLGPEARHTAIRKMKDAAREERKKILTPEQQKKMEEFRKGNPFKSRHQEQAR